jgi:hypothetical protein
MVTMRYVLFQDNYYNPIKPEDRDYARDIRDFADDSKFTPDGFTAADVYKRMPDTHTLVACFDSNLNDACALTDDTAAHLHVIYRLTQNNHDSWSMSDREGLVPAVKSLLSPSGRSYGLGSTYIGAMILSEVGQAWLVTSRGFKNIGPAPAGMMEVFRSFPDGFTPEDSLAAHEFIARQSNLLRQALDSGAQTEIAEAAPDFDCENGLGLSFAPCYCKAHGAVSSGDPAAPIVESVVASPAAPAGAVEEPVTGSVAAMSRRGPR